MSKNIFINNLDTYVSQAIFKELRNDEPDPETGEPPENANNIFGTYIGKDSSNKPEGIKKMLKRSKPNLAKSYVSKCDLIVYDLHAGNPRDVQLAIDALGKPRGEDEGGQEQTLILISSLLAWDRTPKNLEEIKNPDEPDSDEEAKKGEEEENNEENPQGEEAEAEMEENQEAAAAEELEEKKSEENEEAKSGEGQAEGEEGEAEQEEEAEEEEPPAPKPKKRKKYLHHPFTEADYQKRAASEEYAVIKEVEDLVLNFKKDNVKVFVISAGVLYGAGEAIFNSHFKKAWLQDPQKLPVVGEGKNLVPTIHVKDLARMVKKIFEAPPEGRPYIFGIDNTKKPTQKKLIQAISDGIGTGLVESIDIPVEYNPVHPNQTPLQLHLDWRKFVMLNIKTVPSSLFIKEGAEEEGAEPGEDDFNWHCKNGLAKNIQLVKDEFCKERGLKPFKIGILGKPCSGKSFFSQQLAKHFNVPHIHKEQVLEDIQEWNKEKQREYEHKQNEKIRLQRLAEEREAEKLRLEQEEKERIEREKQEAKDRKRAEMGSDYQSEEEVEPAAQEEAKSAKSDNQEDPAQPKEDAKSNGEVPGEATEAQLLYQKQLAKLEADEADTEDEFEPLGLKLEINEFREKNPTEKKIPSELLSRAFRWRMSQNDCQNRGYVLDGYPQCYKTAQDVFVITPEPPKKQEPAIGEDGNPIEVEENPEEEAPPKPQFQQHIYPDSVILIRGSDQALLKKAEGLTPEENTKWDRESMARRLECYNANNDISLYQVANSDPNLGHPKKALVPKYPMTRFYQENKTEIFEIDHEGNQFEMFESMRVYIERNGRSNNYLPPVSELNVEREKHLIKEEADDKAEKASKVEAEKKTAEEKAAGLERLQGDRLSSIMGHMKEIGAQDKLNMRQFLMKQVIPVLTEGMIDVYKVGPTDPVDYLSDYIFKKSNDLRRAK